MNNNSSKVVWFLAGAAVGSALALLFAPQSGEETRALIKDKSIELRDKAGASAEEVIARAEAAAAEARTRAEELAREVRTRGKDVLDDVRERGKEAVDAVRKPRKSGDETTSA